MAQINNQVALEELDDHSVLRFEIQTKIEDESRQKLLGHMCLQHCGEMEYIVQKIPHQEVEDLLLAYERAEEEVQKELNSKNGTEVVS